MDLKDNKKMDNNTAQSFPFQFVCPLAFSDLLNSKLIIRNILKRHTFFKIHVLCPAFVVGKVADEDS